MLILDCPQKCAPTHASPLGETEYWLFQPLKHNGYYTYQGAGSWSLNKDIATRLAALFFFLKEKSWEELI
jgi:hypothetical protein